MDPVVRGLLRKFRRDRGLQGLSTDALFTAFAAHSVLSQYVDDDVDPARLVRGGPDTCARAVLTDGELRTGDELPAPREHRGTPHLIVVHASTRDEPRGGELTDLAERLADPLGARPRLSLWHVGAGRRTPDKKEQRLAGESLTDRFSAVEVRAIAAPKLQRLHERAESPVAARLTLERRLELPWVPGVKRAWLATVPARHLVERLLTGRDGTLRRGLFDENVRQFQEYNGVNLDIRRTLRDELARQRFAVLNNGITVVARRVDRTGDAFALSDFQIVNGCQTCHVLVDERANLDDGVAVTVRLIESDDEEVISRVVTATNQQTALGKEELSAREEFHRCVEEYFAAQPLGRRLYYERRPRQYAGRPDVEKPRVVTRAQLGRAYAALFIEGVGHQQARDDHLFQHGRYPHPCYASAAAHYRLEQLFRAGALPPAYAPARLHLLAGLRLTLVGRRIPRDRPGLTEACDRILAAVWDPPEAEKLLRSLLPVVHLAAGNQSLAEAVRTRHFTEAYRRALVG